MLCPSHRDYISGARGFRARRSQNIRRAFRQCSADGLRFDADDDDVARDRTVAPVSRSLTVHPRCRSLKLCLQIACDSVSLRSDDLSPTRIPSLNHGIVRPPQSYPMGRVQLGGSYTFHPDTKSNYYKYHGVVVYIHIVNTETMFSV